MKNYKHQKKHHGIPGLTGYLAGIARKLKKGNKHAKKQAL